MSRFLLAAALCLALAACDDEPDDPVQTEVVPEADVARLQAEVFRETLSIDAALAELEAEAAAADSVAQAAYAPVLTRLRDERRRLQVRLDSLRPVPRAAFDSLQSDVSAQTDRLREAVRRAPFEAAPTYPALQASAARALSRLDARLGALGPAALADSTGGLRADLDSIAADRARLAARIGAYPDTSAAQFAPFRQSVTGALLRLEERVREVTPDTSRTVAEPEA